MLIFFFFFSSRRRHTRFSRDWSSDVCSSDLPRPEVREVAHHRRLRIATGFTEMDEERVARILVFPVADEPRETIAEGGGSPEGLAHFARRAAAAVRGGVRGRGS